MNTAPSWSVKNDHVVQDFSHRTARGAERVSAPRTVRRCDGGGLRPLSQPSKTASGTGTQTESSSPIFRRTNTGWVRMSDCFEWRSDSAHKLPERIFGLLSA